MAASLYPPLTPNTAPTNVFSAPGMIAPSVSNPPASKPPITPPSPTTPPNATPLASTATPTTPPAYDTKTGLLTDYGKSKNLPEVNAKPAPAPTATPTPAPTPAETDLSNAKAERDKANADWEAAVAPINAAISGIVNGTVPLTAGEQAQVTGLQQQFGDLIKTQTLDNTNASGMANIRGYQTGSAEYDPTFQVKTIGSIVTAGQNKIADLNTRMASAVANLEQTFKANDLAAVKEQFDILQSAQQERTKAIQDTIDQANSEIAAANTARQKVYDQISTIAEDAAKNGASSDVVNKILLSTSVEGAISNAAGSLQTATGELGDFLATNRYLASIGQPQMTLKQYQNQTDLRKENVAAASRAPASEKPATATQITYGNYAPRLETADGTINALTPKITSLPTASFIAQQNLPSWLQTSNVQSFNQAKSNFITAVLRQESGAAISDSEMARYDAQYFPQPGDSPTTIAQKAQNRAQVVASYKTAAGPAYAPPIGALTSNTETNAQAVLNAYTAAHPQSAAKMKADIQAFESKIGQAVTAQDFLQAFPEYAH